MLNLAKRINGVDELMDDFALPASELNPVLKGLGNLNAWFGGHKTLIKALVKFPVQAGNTISDWGCGGGDALKAIASWAAKRKLPLQLTGIDAAPAAISFAQQETAAYPNIHYQLTDVMSDGLQDNQFDIILSSLFTHHFEDEAWIALVKKMYRTAKRGVIITDLHRHWLLYYSLAVIAKVVVRNPMIYHDGLLSVKRSFKKSELKHLLAQAGITHYSIKWKWAFRWQVIIYKP
ncbi:methyltransferase domain-containing protein [Mucilaginibacter robiniae]|uniref:Methyltransferase domain-containing protein n=1 Tax=Mucilaginibacter robiniae TaxID=2728022 RepID=A0A7L5DZ99_9SPHI|nr:methyltransferase domain-containing protein [Mucilaginibacter robiniae]QJD95349.1 methyltransferase domain-containing protein [Mucilaginibacter robiniae]